MVTLIEESFWQNGASHGTWQKVLHLPAGPAL
jgi:hypothetical protein